MAVIQCQECGNDVSTKAQKCPHCGAPFAAFMPKATTFKEFFSEDRVNARIAGAKQKQQSALNGCFQTFFGLVALAVLITIAAFWLF